MEFLKRAEEYAERNGDSFWFSRYYAAMREKYSVRDSAIKALWMIYGTKTVINFVEGPSDQLTLFS